jgi:hypothetical protein
MSRSTTQAQPENLRLPLVTAAERWKILVAKRLTSSSLGVARPAMPWKGLPPGARR